MRLPSGYQPAALPAKPLDAELRVGIVLPAFDRGISATWTAPVEWNGSFDLFAPIPEENVTEVERVYVNAAEPVAAAAPKIFRKLFPRATVLPNQHCPTCDVVFVLKVDSGNMNDGTRIIAGVTVTVRVFAVAPNGVSVASYSADGRGPRTKNMYWSKYTEARAMGEPALREAMDRLFADLVGDPNLKAWVAEKAAERARPSDLETAVTFDDSASYFPNGRLDAGESARLHCRVRNNGAGPAFGVHLRLGATLKGVTVPFDTVVGDIAPGATKEIDIPLLASLNIETALQQVRIDSVEKRGYGGRPIVVEMASEQLKRPLLEIADVALDHGGPRAIGDGDGRPSNGETLEAVILIRNAGPGDAVGAELMIASTSGVEVLDSSIHVGSIAASAVREVRSRIRIPINYRGPDVGLAFSAVETRGVSVALTEKRQAWPLRLKQPKIEIGYRMFDGNSPRSSGNRDGVANNGETLEVALTPINRGTLTARGVRLRITSPVPSLAVNNDIDIGDLPPLTEGTEHRIQIDLPRAFGREVPGQALLLDITITQSDFPSIEQLIALPFRPESPQLVASISGSMPLLEGKPALFTLDIRNDGVLSAEGVTADVTSDDPAVELLNATGKPEQHLRLDFGTLLPGSAGARIQLRAHVRRSGSTTGSVRAVVSQRDFPDVGTRFPLTIAKETPAVISVVPASLPEPAGAVSIAVPAAVSFQRYRDGVRLAQDVIALPFEVQSQVPVEVVRLEQNHRAIELPEAIPERNGGTYLLQFEPRVRLEYGLNTFEVVVITSEGARSSRSMVLARDKPRGRVWIAVIGVSQYVDKKLGKLNFAREDAIAIEDYYRQLGIPSERMIELLDDAATLANMKRSLGTELVQRATNPDDTVLIYFAGHGAAEADRSSGDGDGYSKYLLPHDTDSQDLFGSALSMEELSRILQRLRPERVVLIIDSCFSGAAGGRTPFETGGTRGVITEEFLSRMADGGKGRVILTASGSDEVAREAKDKSHGLFTYFLLEGLRGAADADHDGRIDIDEIYKYVSRKVSGATRGRQNPMRKSPNLTGTIIIGGRLQ